MAAGLIGASVLMGGSQARAEVDYDGIKYLGGGDKIDLNNANIRAYLKVPGIYPTVAGKIVTNGASGLPLSHCDSHYSIPFIYSNLVILYFPNPFSLLH